MELEDIAGKSVNQRLVLRRPAFHHKVRIPIGKNGFFGRSIFAAEPAVQSCKDSHNAGEQFFTIGMISFKLGDDQGPLFLALVIVMFDRPLGGQGSFGGMEL